jgi:hypothetical protein
MVNKDFIIPVQKTDLLSLYGTVLTIANVSFAIAAASVEGDVDITGTGAAGNFLANGPVKSIDFKSGVTGGTVYFIPAYDYAGIKVAGAAATMASESVEVDAANVGLYKAVLSSGEVTISAVTPVIS